MYFAMFAIRKMLIFVYGIKNIKKWGKAKQKKWISVLE